MHPSLERPLIIFVAAMCIIGTLKAQTNDPMPAQVKYSFEYYDVNSNGVLDPEELSRYVFSKWDRDTDGFLRDTEWKWSASGWHQPFTDANLHDFSFWDHDRDGRLRPDEVQGMLNDTSLLLLWDDNGDGIVDRKELADSLVRIYQHDSTVIDPYAWKIFLD